MDVSAIEGRLQQLIQDYLEDKGVDLVEIACRYGAGGLFIKILADLPEGGITLAYCAGLNRELCALLDEKNILSEGYALEVSSPGLDRPLKTEKDFLRAKNKSVKFFLNEPVGAKLEWDGVIEAVKEGAVYIKTGDNKIQLPLSKINKAKRLF